MPNGRKPGQRAAGVPRAPRVHYTKEEKQARAAKREETKILGEGFVVEKIAEPDPLLIPAKVQLAIEYWLDIPARDLKKTLERAAERASVSPDLLRWYLRQENVRAIVDEKIGKIDAALAERRAKARVLTEDYLDAATVKVIESATTPPPQQVRMIEVGYRRFGMLKDKVEATGKDGAPLAFQIVRIGKKADASDA